MHDEELQRSLLQLIDPFITSRGMDLVEMQLSGGRQRKVLRLFVDRVGGVTIDDCAHLSRSVADLLDTHDPIDGRYVLEVSSPGLTRPLRTEQDFCRVAGRQVRVILEGGREHLGILESCEAGQLVITENGERSEVSLSSVKKANLHFE